jgi:hypothetical protein
MVDLEQKRTPFIIPMPLASHKIKNPDSRYCQDFKSALA